MIASALKGSLATWHGLGSETIESVEAALNPITDVEGPKDRERRLGRFAHYRLTRARAPKAVEVWIPVGDSSAALVEIDDPPIKDVDGLLEKLGTPETVEHRQRWLEGHLVDEFAYPGRGLTVSVATPHAAVGVEPPPRGVRRIVHVQLYPSMSAERWRTEIGATVPLRPVPLRPEARG